MKKTFALIFVLLMVVGVFGLDQLEVWVGGEFVVPSLSQTWDSVMTVSPDKWVDLPVYFLGTDDSVFIADLNFNVGVHWPYVDSIVGGAKYFPFANWDIKDFTNFNTPAGGGPGGPTPTAWYSLSFVGFARPVVPTNPWFPMNPPIVYPYDPIQGFDFSIHTNADTLNIVDTICYVGDTLLDAIGPGVDYVVGPSNAGDTLGGAGYPLIQHFACLYYSPNQPPIIDPGDAFTMPYDCGYTDFTTTIDIFDNDGDALAVSFDFCGVAVAYTLINTDQPGGPGTAATYTYELDFDMDAFCGDCWSCDLVVTADDGVNVPATERTYTGPFTIIGEIVADIEDDVQIWPGEEEWMSVYLDACGDCFCLGGFVFTICYDASILDVTDVMQGAVLSGGEYWNVTFPADGIIHFVFINELNDGCDTCDAPLICDIDPNVAIFKIKFLLDGEITYPTDFCSNVCFCPDFGGPNYDYEANNVSDAEGYHTWLPIACDAIPPDSIQYGIMHLGLECGYVKVLNEHNVLWGDINLNGYPNESGDVVLLVNHMIDPIAWPFTLRQLIASDVNRDGHRATIADLIMLINILNGMGPAKLAPIDVVATVAMPDNASGDINVTINSETSVGGALVTINHAGIELGVPVAENMDVSYSDNGDVMTVVVYNMEAASFAPGSNVLFTVPVIGEGEITFGDVQVSDNRGALLDARSELSAPIPTEFTVAQNFPNPFNAKTRINFTVPKEANVNIAVYNVAGQLVENMDLGRMNAGYQSIVWDASDVASGVYFYRVVAGDQSKTLKMTLLK
jgi:hypothetical protein